MRITDHNRDVFINNSIKNSIKPVSEDASGSWNKPIAHKDRDSYDKNEIYPSKGYKAYKDFLDMYRDKGIQKKGTRI